MKKLWTVEMDQILAVKYQENGVDFCSNILGLTKNQIFYRLHKLGIKLSKTKRLEQRKLTMKKRWENSVPTDFNVDYRFFTSNFTKESTYLLGFLWADGYLTNKSHRNQISLEILEKDFKNISHIFQSTGKWYFAYRHRKNRKPQASATTNNFKIYNFLKSYGYETKKISSAQMILDALPDYLLKYWWRGYSDGDGSWYFNYKSVKQFTFAGHYDQNWDFVQKLSKDLGINFKITKKTQKNKTGKESKYSIARISDRNGVIKFGEYIYGNGDYDSIGLRRKFNKFKMICTI